MSTSRILEHWRSSWRDYRTVYGWTFPLRFALFEVRLWFNVRGWYSWASGLRLPRRRQSDAELEPGGWSRTEAHRVVDDEKAP